MKIIYPKVGRWYLFRKVEFFPFDTFLLNEGYIRGKSSALRWRFKNTLFYFTDGYEYSLRGAKDLESLRKFLKRNLNPEFVRQVGKEIRLAARDLLKISKITFASKSNLQKNLENFFYAFKRFMTVFQTPEFAQILTPEKDKKLLYKFGLDRDYAARQLAQIEKIYRSRLGKILKTPYLQALSLLPHEVKEVLETGLFPKDSKKRKTCAILTLDSKTKVFWNKQANQIFAGEVLRYKRSGGIKKLNGETAYPGNARGKVYLAFSAKDFKKIPLKTILVCSMTRYTVVPYLKRAAAIVTDQGGITCHAAIIARELKIPSLIGTGRATDIFKTGDLVEVDAEKGIVKKI